MRRPGACRCTIAPVSDMAVRHGAEVDPGPSALDIPVIPLRDVGRWAIFVTSLLLVLIYLVGVEEGALSVVSSHYVHEFMHDGRHLLAFPCH
jgi:hypothetical protein